MIVNVNAMVLRAMLLGDSSLPTQFFGVAHGTQQATMGDTPPQPTTADPQRLLVDEQEARQLLGGLCAKTLFNFRQRGLPYVKIGSRTMYDPADLRQWVSRQKVSIS